VENWKPRINKDIIFEPCRDKLTKALDKFQKNDTYLLDNNANERSISAKLSAYLQEEFFSWNVDHEYNREDNNPKMIDNNLVIPDIIIHKRGTPQNYCVIEVKKD
jgi:hypothetical protein